jgi:hypothetical protein
MNNKFQGKRYINYTVLLISPSNQVTWSNSIEHLVQLAGSPHPKNLVLEPFFYNKKIKLNRFVNLEFLF